MKILIVMIFTALLSACSTQQHLAAVAAAEAASVQADFRLKAMEFGVCRTGTTGATLRRYGQSDERWAQFLAFCKNQFDNTPRVLAAARMLIQMVLDSYHSLTSTGSLFIITLPC